ncbi:MAG: hypothetical protein HRT37_24410 [Alteromonadaceae bacterium]|nr:hypothetical protein [Alteromonadaceae bacterium]
MQLAKHLQNYAEATYNSLLIHAEFSTLQDRYVFTSNRLLRELNTLAIKYDIQIEIINIECATSDFGIPRFILLTPTHRNAQFNAELEVFIEKYHVEFIAAFVKSYF